MKGIRYVRWVVFFVIICSSASGQVVPIGIPSQRGFQPDARVNHPASPKQFEAPHSPAPGTLLPSTYHFRHNRRHSQDLRAFVREIELLATVFSPEDLPKSPILIRTGGNSHRRILEALRVTLTLPICQQTATSIRCDPSRSNSDEVCGDLSDHRGAR